jgi:hypothetical protein
VRSAVSAFTVLDGENGADEEWGGEGVVGREGGRKQRVQQKGGDESKYCKKERRESA